MSDCSLSRVTSTSATTEYCCHDLKIIDPQIGWLVGWQPYGVDVAIHLVSFIATRL